MTAPSYPIQLEQWWLDQARQATGIGDIASCMASLEKDVERLSDLFTLYYGGVMLLSVYNLARAYRRTTTPTSRRRMIYLLAGAIPMLLLGRFVHGFGLSCYTTAANAYVADVAPSNRRGETMGLFSAAQAVRTDMPSDAVQMIYAGTLLASTSPATVKYVMEKFVVTRTGDSRVTFPTS